MLYTQLSFLLLQLISRPYGSEVNLECVIQAAGSSEQSRTTSASSLFCFLCKTSGQRPFAFEDFGYNGPREALKPHQEMGRGLCTQLNKPAPAADGAEGPAPPGKSDILTPPLTHPSSFPRVGSLTSRATTDPPKASCAATVAPNQSPKNESRRNSSLKKNIFVVANVVEINCYTRNHCYPHILEPQMSGRCNCSSSG